MEKSKIIYLVIGLIIGGLLTFAWFNLSGSHQQLEAEQHNHENEATEEHSEVVNIDVGQFKELGIKLDKVAPQNIQVHSDLTGEIVPIPDNTAHIIPRFNGIVKNVFKKIGDRVKKNDVIAIIESNESLVPYEVKSSIDGIILDLHMTPGELIGDEKHEVTIANLNNVWVELNVYQKDLHKIKKGQNAIIYFDNPANGIEGKIFYISPTVDEQTRTSTARVKLNNSNGFLKPGMFISAMVVTGSTKVEKAVKLNAIQNFEGGKVVFVKDNDGFEPRQVTIGKTNSHYAEILRGLNLGDTYVAEGAFVIKSELMKESFGGGHGH